LCVLNQLTPSRICDGFSQLVVLHHVLDGKIFKEDRAVGVHQSAAQLVGKVFSSVCNTLMDVRDDLAAFGSFVFGVSALRPAEFVLIPPKETRIVHRDTIRESGKGGQTHINTNSQIVEGQGRRFYFTGKAGIPISDSIALNVQSLYAKRAFHGVVLDDFDHTNFRKEQAVVKKFKSCLRVGETMVSTIALEMWVAHLFSMFLHSAKIGLKSKIHSCANFLQDLRIDLRQFRFFSLPNGEQFDGIEARYGFPALLPGVLAGRQSLIENPTTQLQRLQEFGSLAFGWSKAKLEGLHLHVFLIFDVLFDDCQGCTAHCGYEIRIRPESREPALQSRELLAKQERTTSLDALHKFMNSELWNDFTKDMDVIGHDLKFNDRTFQFVSDLLNDLLQPKIYAVYKYLTAILRAENNMVLAGVKNILMAFVCELGADRHNYTAIRCIVKQNRALYPHPLRRGFTAYPIKEI
jgi:hypothetical protein